MGAWRVGLEFGKSGGGGSETGDHKRTTRRSRGRVTRGDKPDVGDGDSVRPASESGKRARR